MSLVLFLSLVVFVAILFYLYTQQRKEHTLSRLVFTGLVLGSLYGLGLHISLGTENPATSQALDWIHIVGSGYIGLLKMVIMPLILVSMISAVVKLEKGGSLGKISSITIFMLLATTAIAALIGIIIANSFGLTAAGLTEGAREAAHLTSLDSRLHNVENLTVPQMLVNFIPTNPFADLTGARSTSIIAVVIFSVLIGIAARKVMHEKEELESPIKTFVDAAQATVMRLVKMIMALTPYGIAALMTKVVATSSPADILNLLGFIVASYVAIILMFVVHGTILTFFGVSPKQYFKKIWPVLTFAFSSRSSAATIPLNVDTQISKLNVPPAIANLSATFVPLSGKTAAQVSTLQCCPSWSRQRSVLTH